MDLAEVRSESFLPTHFKPPSLLQGLYLDGQLQYPRSLPEGSLLLSTLLLSTFLLHQVPNSKLVQTGERDGNGVFSVPKMMFCRSQSMLDDDVNRSGSKIRRFSLTPRQEMTTPSRYIRPKRMD